jgi:hypothetical protein
MEETKERTLVKVDVQVRNQTKKTLYFACAGEMAARDAKKEVIRQLREHAAIDKFHVERIGKVRVLG